MSTIDTFKKLSGVTETSPLEITLERAHVIVRTISSKHAEQELDSASVNILPVSTYVAESKEMDFGSAYVAPKQPPFASHWGILVGNLLEGRGFLFHLVLRDDNNG